MGVWMGHILLTPKNLGAFFFFLTKEPPPFSQKGPGKTLPFKGEFPR